MFSTGRPSTSVGPVQPFGVRRTIIGQRGLPAALPPPAPRAIPSSASSSAGREALVHLQRILAVEATGDEDRPVAVALEQRDEAPARGCARARSGSRSCSRSGAGSAAPRRRSRGSRNLFECQLVASGPVSASPSPTTHATSRLGVVERGAVRVGERVAELPALVDRARRLRRRVARDPAGERELPEQRPQAGLVARRCGSRSRCTCLRDRRSRRPPGPPWPGPEMKIASRSRARISRFRWA